MTARSATRILVYLLLLLVGFVFLYPFLYMAFSSFKSQSEIFSENLHLLPREGWRLANYTELFEKTTFARALINSGFVAAIFVSGSVLLCALGGFAFAKYAFPGREAAFIFMLLTMMVPQGVTLVPLFQIVSWLGWVNTYLPLIVPGLANAFGIFFMRQYARTIPDSLLDAARIDGCSEFGLFWRIVLPLVTPGLMVLACLFFMGSWNDFLWPLVVLNKQQMYTVPIILASFMRGEGDRFVQFGTIFAGSVMGAFPVIAAFLLFQRQFIAGITSGSIKEQKQTIVESLMSFLRRRIKPLISSVLLAGLVLLPAMSVAQTAAVDFDAADPVQAFGAQELTALLKGVSPLQFAETPSGAEDWRFYFKTDPAMPAYAFGVSSRSSAGGKQSVTFLGRDSTATLHALYTFLEKVGYRFELTKPSPPASANLDAVRDWAITIQPRVNKRGIRLHMNFPQDISSYTLEEAKEWVRNAARMRMNMLVFHSYPGRLHTGRYNNELRHAGFMYDERLAIPDDAMFKGAIRNKKFFRVHELEPFMDEEEVRSVKTKEWFASLLSECKRVGLHVRFSFEPRLESMENTLAMCDDILASYPMLDSLEFTTNENGGGGDPARAEMGETIAKYFSPAVYDDPVLKKEFESPPMAMVTMLQELGHNIEAVKTLRDQRGYAKKLSLVTGCLSRPS